ncbi:MAG: polyprenyl diphosphate synthase, partial [Gemmataceae bacterium]
MSHNPLEYARTLGLDPNRFPRHIAIIMDGNGRWAVERGHERIAGHLRGADRVRELVEEATRLGLEQVTLYCFSAENWKRPAAEVEFLMGLLKRYLLDERELIVRENIRFRVIGRREGLSA